MALEGCNTDLSWKAFSQACRISKVLGYFTIDETPLESPNQHQQQQQSHLPAPESQSQSHPETTPHETEIEKNRKRFEFWHILRTDSLFRTSFGKPTLIPPGSWAVNFPDTTIIGIDSSISRFIQIHFLASMRLALIVMKYLDWIDSGTASESEPESDVSHDTTIDGFINEVQSILLDWDTVCPPLRPVPQSRTLAANPISSHLGEPPPNSNKPRRHLVLRRYPIQQLQNANNPLPIKEMQSRPHPARRRRNNCQKVRHQVPRSSGCVYARFLGN
jgi:hypothetical protein